MSSFRVRVLGRLVVTLQVMPDIKLYFSCTEVRIFLRDFSDMIANPGRTFANAAFNKRL